LWDVDALAVQTQNQLQTYGDKISTFVSEKDKGISLATGDLVSFMHSDDLYASSSVVEDVMKQFESDDSLDGVYGVYGDMTPQKY